MLAQHLTGYAADAVVRLALGIETMPERTIQQRGWLCLGDPSAIAMVTAVTLFAFAQFGGATSAAGQRISANGTLQPLSTVTLGSFLSGLVQEVLCDVNATVKQGQVCARIDPRPFQNAVDQARADLAQAKAQLDLDAANLAYAQASFERTSTLTQKGWTSKDAFDNTQSNLGQARARVELDKASIAQRQAALDLANINLGYAEIVSPIEGMVVGRKVEVGETVVANLQAPSLFVIASDLRKLKLVINVAETDVGGLKEGDPATFTVKAFPGQSFKARVSQVRFTPEGQRSDVSYGVTLDVDNSDLKLKPGMTASVIITASGR